MLRVGHQVRGRGRVHVVFALALALVFVLDTLSACAQLTENPAPAPYAGTGERAKALDDLRRGSAFVLLYDEPNYQGHVHSVTAVGAWPTLVHVVRSIRVSRGFRAVLGNLADFEGGPENVRTLTADVADLSSIGMPADGAHSVRVEMIEGALMYERDNFSGTRLFLPVGSDVAHPKELLSFQPRSMRLSPAVIVNMTVEVDAKPQTLIVWTDSPSLRDAMGLLYLNIKIVHRPEVIFYEERFYTEPMYALGVAQYHLDDLPTTTVRSVRVPSGMKAFMCSQMPQNDQPNVTPNLASCITLTSDWPRLDVIPNLDPDKITFISVDAICKPSCTHGTCVEPDRCECFKGFTGPLCEQRDCGRSKVACVHGQCNHLSWCLCDAGWHGLNCSDAMCFPLCENRGKCIAPNTCECLDGYSGPTCTIPPHECGDGVCERLAESCRTCEEDCGQCGQGHVNNMRRSPKVMLIYANDTTLADSAQRQSRRPSTNLDNSFVFSKWWTQTRRWLWSLFGYNDHDVDTWETADEDRGGFEIRVFGVSFHSSDMGSVVTLAAAAVSMLAMAALACVLNVTFSMIGRHREEHKRRTGKTD